MHVDWLTVRQSHGPGRVPVVAEAYVESVKCDTGEPLWCRYVGVQNEGSFRSSLRIRSDGDTVEVSGNPSRWNREDNLFGCSSVEAALAVYNAVLADLGLPPFTGAESTYLASRQLQGSDRLARCGCVLTRVDLTENYSTGGPRNSEKALHALRSFRLRNRAPTDYGSTLMWGGGSRYATVKYYLKGPEMRAHRRRSAPASEYWDRLLAFVESEGILRFEVTCKGEFLRRHGLDSPERWTHGAMVDVMERYAVHGRASATVNSYDQVRDVLLECGLSERRAEACQQAALAYLNGHRFREGMSRSAFYRLRNDLLLVGIDIAAELNVSALRFSVESVPLRPTMQPEWYRAA